MRLVKSRGTRIPPQFRHLVSQRIRHVMRRPRKSDGSAWAHFTAAGDEIGVSTVCVWNWFEGKHLPSLYNLVRFADYYDVSVDFLLGRTAVRELRRRGSLRAAA